MVPFNLKERGLDYNTALVDIHEFIKKKKERRWTDAFILEAVCGIGREARKQINCQLEDMAKRLQKLDCVDSTCQPGNCDCSEDDIMIEQLTEGQF